MKMHYDWADLVGIPVRVVGNRAPGWYGKRQRSDDIVRMRISGELAVLALVVTE